MLSSRAEISPCKPRLTVLSIGLFIKWSAFGWKFHLKLSIEKSSLQVHLSMLASGEVELFIFNCLLSLSGKPLTCLLRTNDDAG